jgi:hypothetical protein
MPPGVTELGIHPGTIDAWRRVEQAPFLSGLMAQELMAHNIRMASYWDV